MGGNNEFFLNFERNKYLKKLPSMQRVNPFIWDTDLSVHYNTIANRLKPRTGTI